MLPNVLASIRSRLETGDRTLAVAAKDQAEGTGQHAVVNGARVSVLFYDGDARLYPRAFPAYTYNIIGLTPRFDEFVFQGAYYNDPYRIPSAVHKATVTADGDDLGQHARAVRVRPIEQPIDVSFEVRTYAATLPELLLLDEHLLANVFRPRDYIRVAQYDGSYRSWDVLFQESHTANKTSPALSGALGTQREFCRVWTWRIEAYLDTTQLTKLRTTVQERQITLGKKDDA